MRGRRTPGLLGRARDGAVGLLMALMTMAVFATAGVAVDTGRVMFVRERLISALDSAALAGGRVINSGAIVGGMPQYQYDAATYFSLNFKPNFFLAPYFFNTTLTSFTTTLSPDGTQLSVSAAVTLPLLFGPFIGYTGPISISTTAKALAGKLEVALVLDNTGSMAQPASGDSTSKISVLKTAAANFITALTSLGNNNVRIAVVPFTMTVNVGSGYGPGYNADGTLATAAASWLDSKASYIYASSLKNALTSPPSSFQDVFTYPNGTPYQMDRWALFQSLKAGGKSAGWAGCVEMRAPVYNTVTQTTTRYDLNDIAATQSDPASLFVPYFAPSEPTYPVYPSGGNNYVPYFNVYLQDHAGDDSTYGATTYDNPSATGWQVLQGDYQKYNNPTMTVSTWSQAAGTWTSGTNTNVSSLSNGYTTGPNAGCQGFDQNNNFVTLLPLMRLSTNTTSLISQINNMVPMGGTFIPSGLFWGWETISPNSVFPDNQVAYSNPDVTKVVILLTDGCNSIGNPNSALFGATSSQDACGNYQGSPNNTIDPNQSYYQSNGYVWQNRLGTTSAVESARASAADQMMATMCANMQADHILMYTIGIGPNNTYSPALQNCATSPANFFPISSPSSDLNNTFAKIAAQLTKVRIIPTSVPSD